MRRRICLYALCLVAFSAAAMPIGLHLAALGDADANDDGPGAAVAATTPDGGSVSVPEAWLVGFPDVLTAANGSGSTAVANLAANGRKVWECYALGLDPEDNSATNDFRITSFPLKADGTPDIEHIVFDPPQAKWNVPATYKVKGAANLSDTDWPEVTEGNKGLFRFFKVELVLP